MSNPFMKYLLGVLSNAASSSEEGHVPSVPEGYVTPDLSGTATLAAESALGVDAARDLEAFAAEWHDVFGRTAPDPLVLAEKLRQAGTLTIARRRAEAWAAFVSDQERLVWRDAQLALDEVRPMWTALAPRAGLGAKLPHLRDLFAVREHVAKRAASARRRKATATRRDQGKPTA